MGAFQLECDKLGLKFSPKTIVADIEIAIHSVIKFVWPHTELIGCRFHISQAWWRNIQHLRLAVEYNNKTDIGKWLGYCFGLVYLEPEDVGEGFCD